MKGMGSTKRPCRLIRRYAFIMNKEIYYLGKGALEDNIFHERSWAFVGCSASEPIAMFETAELALEYVRMKNKKLEAANLEKAGKHGAEAGNALKDDFQP